MRRRRMLAQDCYPFQLAPTKAQPVPRARLVASRITHTDKFPARSDRGNIRTIVCSEDHIEEGGVGATAKYYVPRRLKTYTFENGEPAAKIDAFLDRSGEIYRRMTYGK
jgi:hypothetical protein